MRPDLTRAPNVNALWAGLLVEELIRQGVGLFVVCPGSRSAPLAVAVAHAVEAGRTTWLVHPDERAAAFVALGWGRATGRPAAVVTTSGTAVANLLPAAVEADAAVVPLLLLTADRPPELRETGANQTIRQPGLFGTFVRWAFDVPPPTADVDPAFVLTTAGHAAVRSLHPAGPVHLNLAFREPLGNEPDGTDAAALLAPLHRWTANRRPYTAHDSYGDLFGVEQIAKRLAGIERGLIVLGGTADGSAAEPASDLAAALHWPLLLDVTVDAGAVSEDARAYAVRHYDLTLASDAFAEAHRPDAVVLVGARPTSKRLLHLIDAARPGVFVVIRSGPERFDPGHAVTDRIETDPGLACGRLQQAVDKWRPSPDLPKPDGDWPHAWRRAAEAAEYAAVDEIDGALSEPFVARTMAARTPGALVLAASMPIRDAEMFGPLRLGDRLRTVANRGASGIDGTVATAHGVARATGQPTVLLIGDLALLHDQTSLMLLRSGPPVVVVVVNNDGGGIFHFLPVARGAHPLDAATFESAIAAPHGLTFEHAAAQVGLSYHAPTTADAFEAALDAALASGASAVIEVRTDRAENEALHARITAAVAAAVDSLARPGGATLA